MDATGRTAPCSVRRHPGVSGLNMPPLEPRACGRGSGYYWYKHMWKVLFRIRTLFISVYFNC